jgi:heat-inducible transcriptional repressor
MELSERKKRILAAVVDDYIQTAEPVGSKTIAQKFGLGFSSATIRSELSELTVMGTSSSRIPPRVVSQQPLATGYMSMS